MRKIIGVNKKTGEWILSLTSGLAINILYPKNYINNITVSDVWELSGLVTWIV